MSEARENKDQDQMQRDERHLWIAPQLQVFSVEGATFSQAGAGADGVVDSSHVAS